MTLQNLSKILDKYDQQFGFSNISELELLKGLPFYNFKHPEGSNTFNHAIGPVNLPKFFRKQIDYEALKKSGFKKDPKAKFELTTLKNT